MKTTENVLSAIAEISTIEKTAHVARFYNRVISSEQNAVHIDSDINIARIFSLENVDFAILASLHTMADTQCRTFTEIKEKTVKLIEKSGLAIANKNSSLIASFYKWRDMLTDDRIKQNVVLLASMYNGYHIILNKNGMIAVQKNTKKESLLSAKFYKNVELIGENGIKSKEKIRVKLNTEFISTFGNALETANYKLITAIVKPIAIETEETETEETVEPEVMTEEKARAENLKKSEETRLKNSSGYLARNPESESKAQ